MNYNASVEQVFSLPAGFSESAVNSNANVEPVFLTGLVHSKLRNNRLGVEKAGTLVFVYRVNCGKSILLYHAGTKEVNFVGHSPDIFRPHT